MQIGTRVRYGMLAMMELARRGGKEPSRALDIAKAYGLSKGYLEGLLATLKRAGLVRAVRGPGGGWVLVKGATKIKPLDIYSALEGTTTLVPCAENASLCPTKQSKCRARSLWVAMGKALEKTLKTDSLAVLAGVAPKKKKKAKAKVKKRVAKKAKTKAKAKPKAKKRVAKKVKTKLKLKLKKRPTKKVKTKAKTNVFIESDILPASGIATPRPLGPAAGLPGSSE
jgi:Rrf2 family iron-sulfur cluster assembly transcriptional regulator